MNTRGERTQAPALADPGWSAVSVKSRLRSCRQLSERLPAALGVRLLAFGNALLDSHGVR